MPNKEEVEKLCDDLKTIEEKLLEVVGFAVDMRNPIGDCTAAIIYSLLASLKDPVAFEELAEFNKLHAKRSMERLAFLERREKVSEN